MSDEPESPAGEEELDDLGPEPTDPVHLVELEGGPLEGRRAASELSVVWIAFHDTPVKGMIPAYRPTGRFTRDGLPIFEWIATPPEMGG